MRAGQLGLRKTRGLSHHFGDLIVGIPLDIVQPHHRSGRVGEALQRRLEVHPKPEVLVTAGATDLTGANSIFSPVDDSSSRVRFCLNHALGLELATTLR